MPYSTSRRTALALSRVFLPPPLLRLLPFLALYSIHLRGEPQADYNSSSLPRRPCPPPANLATHHCFVLSRPRSSTVRPPVSCWHPPAPPDAVPERGQLLRRTSSSSTLIDARSAYFNYLFFFGSAAYVRCSRDPPFSRDPGHCISQSFSTSITGFPLPFDALAQPNTGRALYPSTSIFHVTSLSPEETCRLAALGFLLALALDRFCCLLGIRFIVQPAACIQQLYICIHTYIFELPACSRQFRLGYLWQSARLVRRRSLSPCLDRLTQQPGFPPCSPDSTLRLPAL